MNNFIVEGELLHCIQVLLFFMKKLYITACGLWYTSAICMSVKCKEMYSNDKRMFANFDLCIVY